MHGGYKPADPCLMTLSLCFVFRALPMHFHPFIRRHSTIHRSCFFHSFMFFFVVRARERERAAIHRAADLERVADCTRTGSGNHKCFCVLNTIDRNGRRSFCHWITNRMRNFGILGKYMYFISQAVTNDLMEKLLWKRPQKQKVCATKSNIPRRSTLQSHFLRT